jgi:glutamine amidotransferase
MGWNQIVWPKTHHLFKDMPELPPRFYFVHSFHVHAAHPQDVLAETFYGYPFASAIGANNIWGVQFHPEKSHKFGMQLLKNFVEY